MKLKTIPAHIQPFTGRSDALTVTSVPVGSNPRDWYLSNASTVRPPCISSSDFVPRSMIEHLMRKKKNSALGVKFDRHGAPPDQITNMEGAMHTFVTPLVQSYIHGDYTFRGGHGMSRFPPVNDMQQARVVVVSAQIQPDFEDQDVLFALAALNETPCVGSPLRDDFTIPDVTLKQAGKIRAAYDESLRCHMVQYLTNKGRVPSIHEVADGMAYTVDILEDFILNTSVTSLSSVVKNPIWLSSNMALSLELLFNTAVHQLHNELSALEALCPQGYVYTSDPPSIFAREIGAKILNRLQFAALSHLASANTFSKMRAFAFNDYADAGAIDLVKAALSCQPHVVVVPKKDLFTGPRRTYTALPGTEGSLLVIHNNSDGFGQNIETEWASGSMDGAIGANSSAAASLRRSRADLVSDLM